MSKVLYFKINYEYDDIKLSTFSEIWENIFRVKINNHMLWFHN